MLIGVAALFGLLIAFSIFMGVIQSVGKSIGLLPMRAPTPTSTPAPTELRLSSPKVAAAL